jgi:hypothetical protein
MNPQNNPSQSGAADASRVVTVDAYAKKIAAQLDASTASISGPVASRLNQSRQRALSAYREPIRLFGVVPVGGPLRDLKANMSEHPLAFGLPLLFALIIGSYGVINALNDDDDDMFAEAGQVDAAILASDLPLQPLSQVSVESFVNRSN